ncbi:unnamed protein product [Brachionus calyciflorus]|uniref:Uncharacterized protein n=1 Tax=Brachionus calyciflorus TaxID=104777 RepID=A0A813YSM6_9BILA|nr:unnamed protein product [Brachionus calyciflorus]
MFKKYSLIFNFFLLGIVLCQNNDQTITEKNSKSPQLNCKNPSVYELDKKLWEYKLQYYKYHQIMYASKKIQEVEQIKNESLIFKENGCWQKKRNLNEQLCSSTFEFEFSNERYPLYSTNAKCDCKYCSMFFGQYLNSDYECLPITEKQPVLARGECSSDGYYQWIETTQLVIKGCTCGYKYQLVEA